MDSGQNVPLEFIDKGIKKIKENDCDILIGSRYLPESIIKKKLIWYRYFTSRWFKKMVKLYLQIPDSISDTQCGFKIFKGEPARQLFENCRSDGFIFDLEIILIALKKKFKICEFAIEWTCDRDSRLSLLKAILPVYKDLRKLRQTYL
jgi:dolichyl-phosphate beta-glucosyltransferase